MEQAEANQGCKNAGCIRRHYAKGLCKSHYTAEWRRNNPSRDTFCQIDGCERKSYFNKYCTSHRERLKSGELDKPIRPGKYSGCSVSRCDSEHYGKGYCRQHHYQLFLKGQQDSINTNLKYKYGITRAERDAMFEAQGWACAICDDDQRQLLVDHDHNHCGGARNGCPNCVRGGLCAKCNTLLTGLENKAWRNKAENYLLNPPGLRVSKSR